MIYIDKCRTDLGISVDEWAVDDRCQFSDSGRVGIGTGVRVLDVTDKFGDVAGSPCDFGFLLRQCQQVFLQGGVIS